MHVKYASRHTLYPGVTMFDTVDTVARTDDIMLLVVVATRCGVDLVTVALRVGVTDDTARAIVADCRAVVFTARVAIFCVYAFVRVTLVDVARAVVLGVCCRADTFFCDVRVGELVLRTAALATPTLTKIVRIMCNTFLILSTINIMISKNVLSDKKNE